MLKSAQPGIVPDIALDGVAIVFRKDLEAAECAGTEGYIYTAMFMARGQGRPHVHQGGDQLPPQVDCSGWRRRIGAAGPALDDAEDEQAPIAVRHSAVIDCVIALR